METKPNQTSPGGGCRTPPTPPPDLLGPRYIELEEPAALQAPKQNTKNTHRQTQRHRNTKTQRHRGTGTQTHGDTGRHLQRRRQAQTQAQRHRGTETQRHTDRHIDIIKERCLRGARAAVMLRRQPGGTTDTLGRNSLRSWKQNTSPKSPEFPTSPQNQSSQTNLGRQKNMSKKETYNGKN